jgi:VWFA-related protein
VKVALASFVVALLSLSPNGARQVIRSGVDAVRVDVLVTDGRTPIAGLTAADFEVKDNGVTQRVSVVTMEEVPISLMLAADVSASMSGKRLAVLKSASHAAMSALKSGDRAALVTFSQRVSLLSGWTADRAGVNAAIERVTVGGGTALNHAISYALMYRDQSQNRALALVFSDGMDTASILTHTDVVALGDRSDVVVYGVSLADPRDSRLIGPDHTSGIELRPPASGPTLIEAVSGATGGRTYRASNESQLKEVFVRVIQDFRSRYVLGFTPEGVAPDGWHRLAVTLKHHRGEVTARRGYMR